MGEISNDLAMGYESRLIVQESGRKVTPDSAKNRKREGGAQ